ncbi:hypothetical protein E4U55_004701 [Claviceps digitariae]|nr:hypothetical protein E4U55_004701 [Claviceps digitariae]
MAAASASSPALSAAQNVNAREHMALHRYSSSSPTAGQDVRRRPLNTPSLEADNAILRHGPFSPVRVDCQDEALPEPSNVNIENATTYSASSGVLEDVDRRRSTSSSSHYRCDVAPVSSQPAQSYTVNSVPSGVDNLAAEFSHVSIDLGLSTSSVADLQHQDRSPHQHEQDTSLDSRRESNETTTSTSRQRASAHSPAATSSSSVYGINDNSDYQPTVDSPASSFMEGIGPKTGSAPPFHSHHHQHQQYSQRTSIGGAGQFGRSPSADLNLEHAGNNIRRHLTPSSQYLQRSSLTRPLSAYSNFSDYSSRCRSPNLTPGGSYMRPPSVPSRKSPENRLSTYAELLNVPYPQQSPAPLSLDNSNLRTVIGSNASLLSTQKTLDMYRQNVKKTMDFSIQYSFAVLLISTAQEQGLDLDSLKETTTKRKTPPPPLRDLESPIVEANVSSPYDLVREARQILQRLANGGYPFAQYYLADGYASGLFSKGKEDYSSAFPLFVLAAKHGHAESAYRTALCYEFGWGCRKDPAKAVQFLRSAASKRHPGAMTRLGKACLSGDLGEKRYREGLKWLKLATEAADSQYNAAPYQLGCLYETGYGDDIFADESYAAELFTQAADLGHPEANYRMGDAYEHGRLNCPRDPALSVHFYTGAAERDHSAAMMGLCAWYLVGAPPVLEKDEEEAYEWARRSAELGFVKAQYAVGYFTEMGIGCRRDVLEANVWYVRAADAGDERARQRIAVIQAAVSGQGTPMEVAPPRVKKGDKDDKDCVVM